MASSSPYSNKSVKGINIPPPLPSKPAKWSKKEEDKKEVKSVLSDKMTEDQVNKKMQTLLSRKVAMELQMRMKVGRFIYINVIYFAF